MATTTFSAIRDRQRTVIEALTPTTRGDVKYLAARDEQDFRAWAQANKAAAFRRFTLINGFEYTEPEVDNHDVMYQRMTEEIVIAYPKAMGTYGLENRRDLHDVMDEDWRQIDKNIGPYGQNLGNWLDGQSYCSLKSVVPVEEDDIVFTVLTYEVGFYRDR